MEDEFLTDDFVTKFWPKPTSNIGVWTTIPKSHQPVTFSSVLNYASQVGDAAKSGYEVVFRQPRIHELFSVTPVSRFKSEYFVYSFNVSDLLVLVSLQKAYGLYSIGY